MESIDRFTDFNRSSELRSAVSLQKIMKAHTDLLTSKTGKQARMSWSACGRCNAPTTQYPCVYCHDWNDSPSTRPLEEALRNRASYSNWDARMIGTEHGPIGRWQQQLKRSVAYGDGNNDWARAIDEYIDESVKLPMLPNFSLWVYTVELGLTIGAGDWFTQNASMIDLTRFIAHFRGRRYSYRNEASIESRDIWLQLFADAAVNAEEDWSNDYVWDHLQAYTVMGRSVRKGGQHGVGPGVQLHISTHAGGSLCERGYAVEARAIHHWLRL